MLWVVIEDKRKLIGSIFQNKIHFENKKVRTANVNPILNEISSVNRAYGGIKKWDKSKKLELSHIVSHIDLFSNQVLEFLDIFTNKM